MPKEGHARAARCVLCAPRVRAHIVEELYLAQVIAVAVLPAHDEVAHLHACVCTQVRERVWERVRAGGHARRWAHRWAGRSVPAGPCARGAGMCTLVSFCGGICLISSGRGSQEYFLCRHRSLITYRP